MFGHRQDLLSRTSLRDYVCPPSLDVHLMSHRQRSTVAMHRTTHVRDVSRHIRSFLHCQTPRQLSRLHLHGSIVPQVTCSSVHSIVLSCLRVVESLIPPCLQCYIKTYYKQFSVMSMEASSGLVQSRIIEKCTVGWTPRDPRLLDHDIFKWYPW